jgi:hypothetical protein
VWRRLRAAVNTTNGVSKRLGNTTGYDCGFILKSPGSENGCFISNETPKVLEVLYIRRLKMAPVISDK